MEAQADIAMLARMPPSSGQSLCRARVLLPVARKGLAPGTHLAALGLERAARRAMNPQGGPKHNSDEVVQAILMAAIALCLLALLWLLP
jgi:hypothetical protein